LKIHLPILLEPPLALLPRTGLDAMEIGGFPPIPVRGSQALPRRRIAVVKSPFCAHIYTRPWKAGGDLRHLALSTLKTFGPLSLFTRHQTDFFIVRLPDDPECQVWREFYAGDPDQAASKRIHEDFPNYRPTGEPSSNPTQGELAVDPEAVDWSRYEAVIVQDLCIPARIVRRFPKVLWSYWIGETGSPSFKSSSLRTLANYHLYLNGSSRRWRVRPSLRRHVLEFPYIIQDSQAHTRLGGRSWKDRAGILLEVNTAREIPPEIRRRMEALGPVEDNLGTPTVRLERLHRSRYFLQMTPKRLWGNSLNEAVAAGCLGIANPASMPNNRSLLLPGLTPRDWESALRLLQTLVAEPADAESLQATQQRLADWFLCDRPLGEWEQRLAAFQAGGAR
jgi:hypothetical protein